MATSTLLGDAPRRREGIAVGHVVGGGLEHAGGVDVCGRSRRAVDPVRRRAYDLGIRQYPEGRDLVSIQTADELLWIAHARPPSDVTARGHGPFVRAALK